MTDTPFWLEPETPFILQNPQMICQSLNTDILPQQNADGLGSTMR